MIDMGEEEKSKRRSSIVLIIVVVAILVALWITVPNIPKLFEEEEKTTSDIYQQYDEFQGDNILTYKNEQLNVTITRNYNARRNTTGYEAHWVNIWGDESSVLGRSYEALYDEILRQGLSLSTNQIKWFEYMIENIVE